MAGLYTHITRATGTILTAAIYNADHQNHIDNHIPAMIDDYSVNLAQMQAQVDPGELGTENLAVSLAGEIERFRWALKELKGTTYWYESAVNLALISSANVFTAAQTVQLTTAGTHLTLRSTDSGASQGPNLDLVRQSTTPAALDVMGGLRYIGRDSGNNDTTYAEIVAQIADPTNGSEDVNLYFNHLVAGAAQTWAYSAGSMFHLPVTGGGTKGAGTVNAQGLYVQGHGTIGQHQVAFNSTYTVLGTILPQDDTIPQITEGDQVLSVTITPTHANSRIWIVAQLNVGGAAALVITAAIFRTGFSDASNAASMLVNAATTMEQVIVCASYDAVDTTARTYTVRAGSSTATDAKLNGDNTNRNFGGSSVSRVDVFEILPQ